MRGCGLRSTLSFFHEYACVGSQTWAQNTFVSSSWTSLVQYAGILSPPPPGHSMNNLYNSPWFKNIESSLSSQLPFPAGLSSYADVRLQLLNSPIR